MMRLKLVALLLGTTTAGFVSAASAADLPARPVYKAPIMAPAFSWTGFYLGAHIGGGWGHSDWLNADPTFGPVGRPDAAPKPNGFIGGGQIGYNWQFSNVVLGIEGEFSGSTVKDTVTGCFDDPLQSCTSKVDWKAALTGRLGYAIERTLFYVKGGGAWAKYKYANPDPLNGGTFTASDTHSGWTVGGGFEYAFAGNWSLKFEYDYTDFGTKTVNFPAIPTATGFQEGFKNTINEVKVGVNYRFGGPY